MADDDITRKVSGIYAIRNLKTGRVYVGSSLNIHARWREHRSRLRKGTHHAPQLQMAWNKYGEAAFLFEIIEAVIAERVELLVREQHWIDALNAYGFGLGYNGRPIAASPLGTKSPAVAAANATRIFTAEMRAKQSAARTGKKRTPKTAALIRVILTQRNQTPGSRALTALRNKSPEMRASVSLATKGKPKSAAHAAKIREAMTGKPAVVRKVYKTQPRSPEHEAKLIASTIERNKSPEFRAHLSTVMRAKWARWKEKQS